MLEVAGGIILAVVFLAVLAEALTNDLVGEKVFDLVVGAVGIALVVALLAVLSLAVLWWVG